MKYKVGILLLVAMICLSGCTTEEKNNKIEPKIISSMICTYEEETKEGEIRNTSIELSFENGVLTTKKDIFTWENSTQATCDFYKKREEVYKEMSGVSDTVSCDANRGVRTTIYTFANLLPEEIRLAESRYVRETEGFDYESYKTFRQNDGYHCVVQ